MFFSRVYGDTSGTSFVSIDWYFLSSSASRVSASACVIWPPCFAGAFHSSVNWRSRLSSGRSCSRSAAASTGGVAPLPIRFWSAAVNRIRCTRAFARSLAACNLFASARRNSSFVDGTPAFPGVGFSYSAPARIRPGAFTRSCSCSGVITPCSESIVSPRFCTSASCSSTCASRSCAGLM
jgi:hypothetical protein